MPPPPATSLLVRASNWLLIAVASFSLATCIVRSNALFYVALGLLFLSLLVAAVLYAESRRSGLRRAGISLLAAAGVLYLLFDGLVAIFFRASRSVEAEVAGRLYESLVQSWSGYAAMIALAGAVLVAGSLLIRR